MKLKCFILDDEYYSRNIIKDHIAIVPFLEFAGEAEDPIGSYELIHSASTDLLFLDINMPNISGVTFLENHRDLPLTIMTTAHPEHALQTYKFKVIDYLLKPVIFEDFYRAVLKAKDFLESNPKKEIQENNDNYFFVKASSKFEKVIFDELLYAEAKDNYVILHTELRKIMVYMTFKDISSFLAKKRFVKIHKSYIVNIDHIVSIDNDEVKIDNGVLPVSRNFRNDLIQAIQNKILKRL